MTQKKPGAALEEKSSWQCPWIHRLRWWYPSCTDKMLLLRCAKYNGAFEITWEGSGWHCHTSTRRRKSLTSSGGHKKACPPYSASRLVGWARFYHAHQNECRISARVY